MKKLNEQEIKIYAQAHEFLLMKDLYDLANLLQLPVGVIMTAVEHSDLSYSTFKIGKKKGGYRSIDAPSASLKNIQKRINFLLGVIYYRMKPACVHGFVKTISEEGESYSIVSNAAPHVKAHYVLNIDLKDFFHSIDIWRVKQLFMSYPFFLGNDMAAYLALLTTHQDRLPMGAPTSPVISNFACFLFDRRMMRFAEEQELNFTRYADDLTFSSKRIITPSLIAAIKEIIREYQFEVNEEKTRLLTQHGSQMVTGLKVNEKVNVNRTYIRNIRAMLNNWATHGLVKAADRNRSIHQFLNILEGKLNFLSMVKGKDDPVYRKLQENYQQLALKTA